MRIAKWKDTNLKKWTIRTRTHLILDNNIPNFNIVLTEEARNWSRSIVYFTGFSWITIQKEKLELYLHNKLEMLLNIYHAYDPQNIMAMKLKTLPISVYVLDFLDLYLEWK